MEQKHYNLRNRKILSTQKKVEKVDKIIEDEKKYNLRNRKILSTQKKVEKVDKIIEDKSLIFDSREEDFVNKSINPSNFYIEDVAGDNACFYRCISNTIKYWENDRKFENNFNFNLEEQDKISRKIQKIICKWLYKNKDKIIEELNITVKEFVIYTHDLINDYDCENYTGNNLYDDLMYEYLKRYSRFAGDDIVSEYDRWGGSPEQYAISEIFEVPVYTYVYKKFNRKTGKIENGKIRGNKPEKNVRFKLYQVFGKKYSNKKEIHLLYKNNRNCDGHYLCLYKK